MSKQNLIVSFIIIIVIVGAVTAWSVLERSGEGGEQPSALPEGEERPPEELPAEEIWEGDETIQPGGSLGGFPIEPVIWDNPEKPMASRELKEAEVPEGAVRMGVSAEGFSPSTFEIKAGQKVVLALTSTDQWTHLLMFKGESLSDVYIEVASGQIKAITFYAPQTPGEYEFFCYVPGHERRGEKGVMVVK